MQIEKEIFHICIECTFFDHSHIDRVIELTYVRDCVIKVLSESDFKHEDNGNIVMSFIDDFWLTIVDGDVENTENEIRNWRVATLQLLRLVHL